MTEYLCLTLVANAGESEGAFRARLTAFWSGVLRSQPDAYEALYAEATAFERSGGRVSRAYMVAADAAGAVSAAARAAGVEALPLDPDDVYTKYEASGTEWFQVEH